jgi:hypothetical protein
MIAYFRELLDTLKRIEKHLEKLAMCVSTDHHRYVDRASLSTKHWND